MTQNKEWLEQAEKEFEKWIEDEFKNDPPLLREQSDIKSGYLARAEKDRAEIERLNNTVQMSAIRQKNEVITSLKSQLSKKDKLIEEIKIERDQFKMYGSDYYAENKKLQEQIKQKDETIWSLPTWGEYEELIEDLRLEKEDHDITRGLKETLQQQLKLYDENPDHALLIAELKEELKREREFTDSIANEGYWSTKMKDKQYSLILDEHTEFAKETQAQRKIKLG